MSRITVVVILTLLAGLLAGCGASRTTTTDKTALERALMWQSIDPGLAAVDTGSGRDRSFSLHTDEIETEYEKVIISRAREELLRNGFLLAEDPEEADVIVYARADYAGIDDASFLIGIPAIPIVTPAGGLETPELALFKRENQSARNRLSLYGVERESGRLAFEDSAQGTNTYFTRWRILFVIGFRTTNLESPF